MTFLAKLDERLRPAWGKEYSSHKPDDLIPYFAETVKRSEAILIGLLGFASYCSLTLLGTQDAELLRMGPTINLPLVGARIALSGFVIAAPAVLLALTAYLHIYLEHLRHLAVIRPVPVAALLELPYWPARLFVEIASYWLPPAVVALFYWKAMLLDYSEWLFALDPIWWTV